MNPIKLCLSMKTAIFILACLFIISGRLAASQPLGAKIISIKNSKTTYHYEPVPGKLVGIWPAVRYWTADGAKTFKKKWGFSGIVVMPEMDAPYYFYKKSIDAGFKPENIMVLTHDDSYIQGVDEMPAGYYYLDEPVEHDCSGHASNGTHIYPPAELQKRYSYVHEKRPDAKFVIGGYKRCSHLKIAVDCADNVMYTSYVNWSSLWLPVCHVNMGFGDNYEAPWNQGNTLQTDSWKDMRSKYGEKFSMAWMTSKGDEYAQLFAEASAEGLKGIWLYALENWETDSASTLAKFCDAAWQNGWLNKVEDTPPGEPPVLIQPLKGMINLPEVNVSFAWTRVQDAEGYRFQLSKDGSFTECHTDTTINADTCLTIPLLEKNRYYYWRVQAVNFVGAGSWTEAGTFTTIPQRPSAPALITPGNGALNQMTELRMSWSGQPGTEGYVLHVAKDSLFLNMAAADSAITSQEYNITGLEKGSRYYWRVGAKNAGGMSPYSPVNSFITLMSPPESLKAEVSGKHSIMLLWNDKAENETGFILEKKSSRDSSFSILSTLKANSTSYTDTLVSSGLSYKYRIKTYNEAATSFYSNEAEAAITVTAVSGREVPPTDYVLYQNFPNPYNPSTRISYMLPSESRIRVIIYNSIGSIVKELANEIEQAGYHELDFRAGNLPSGTYFYSMEARPVDHSTIFRSVKKMLLLK